MALYILLGIVLGAVIGALLGLIPFFVGRNSGRSDLGKLGFIFSIVAGASLVFSWAVPAVVAGFTIAIVLKGADQASPGQPPAPPLAASSNVGVRCIAGPLVGKSFSIGPDGIIIGRDHDCAIRFAKDQPGISRHHCSIRWDRGGLILTDMGSSHGTFLQNGMQVYNQQPTPLPVNTCFYLANASIMFQVVII